MWSNSSRGTYLWRIVWNCWWRGLLNWTTESSSSCWSRKCRTSILRIYTCLMTWCSKESRYSTSMWFSSPPINTTSTSMTSMNTSPSSMRFSRPSSRQTSKLPAVYISPICSSVVSTSTCSCNSTPDIPPRSTSMCPSWLKWLIRSFLCSFRSIPSVVNSLNYSKTLRFLKDC